MREQQGESSSSLPSYFSAGGHEQGVEGGKDELFWTFSTLDRGTAGLCVPPGLSPLGGDSVRSHLRSQTVLHRCYAPATLEPRRPESARRL